MLVKLFNVLAYFLRQGFGWLFMKREVIGTSLAVGYFGFLVTVCLFLMYVILNGFHDMLIKLQG